jgi:Recombination endonuclease VII
MKKDLLYQRFGINEEQYRYLAEMQNHKCAICREHPKENAFAIDCVDGKVRGLLCFECNSIISLARDKPNVLRCCISYLESHS